MGERAARKAPLASAWFVVLVVLGCATGPASPAPSAAVTTSPPATIVPTGSGPTSEPASSSGSPSSSSGLPDFAHVWIIVLENHSFADVVGASEMPYLNSLIEHFGLAERSSGVSRPSEPNYLALFSGSTHDVRDDRNHDIDAPNVADQIEASGRTWKEYAENRPPDCFTGSSASGGRDGAGEYRRKHAPAISFDAIRSDPKRCANLVDFTAFKPGDVDYSLIIPNQCHDGHDCSLADADDWLASFVPAITDSEAFASGGLLIVTFDEDDGNDPSGGHIATVVASPKVPAGFRSQQPHDHYGVLRTIEDAWGLGCIAESCSATPLNEFFGR